MGKGVGEAEREAESQKGGASLMMTTPQLYDFKNQSAAGLGWPDHLDVRKFSSLGLDLRLLLVADQNRCAYLTKSTLLT